jgi:predicted AAA+ superfamily ATPase
VRITRFEAENFKRLKVVEIDPDDNTVVLGGRNAQGKSSVLDAIMAALAGKAGAKELTRPIRDGEKKARVVVELDDIRVERKWTPSGSTLTVGPKDGAAKFTSPQAVLDKLIGALAFDPLEFALAPDKAQVERLIDIVGREEFDEIAAERKDAYDIRTENNREVKSVKARIEGLGDVVETERVDMAALMAEIGHANRKAALTTRWQDLTEEIERLTAARSEVEAEGLAIPETRDLEVLQVELEQADQTNQAAQAWTAAENLRSVLAGVEQTVADCTAKIEALDMQKTALIEAAALPVEGLAFDEDGVTYHGVPFRQASAAERLRVSVGIAMAMNPDLRVICIRDASLLDDDSRAALVAMAKEHDYQIWYEVVGDPGSVGVVLEDGEIQ